MPASSLRIIAVAPGTRTTGVAVLGSDADLRRFDVVPLGRQSTLDAKAARLRLHLAAVLDIEQPAEVLCEALQFGRETPANKHLAAAVHDLVTERELPLRYVLLRDARTSLGLGRDLAAELAEQFPHLWRCAGDGEDQRRYWSRAFVALAIALAEAQISRPEDLGPREQPAAGARSHPEDPRSLPSASRGGDPTLSGTLGTHP